MGKGKNKTNNPSLAAVIAAAAAATVKAMTKGGNALKEAKKKSKANTSLEIVPARKSRVVIGPAVRGRTFSTNSSHTPFVVKGNSLACYVSTSVNGSVIISQNTAVLSSGNTFDVDPAGNGASPYNFQSFPGNLAVRLCTCFYRYRFKKLVAKYVPVCPTSTPGSVVMGPIAESVSIGGNANFTYAEVSSFQLSASSPAWGEMSLDLLRPGGLSKDWHFVDSSGTNAQSNLRQECAGALSIAVFGQPAVATSFGALYFDYELEFSGLGVEFVGPTLAASAAASSSSSSSSSFPHAAASAPLSTTLLRQRQPDEDEADRYVSVQAPSPLTRR